jgi:Fe-S-cluster containining protein
LGFQYPKHLRFICEKCTLCCGDTREKVRLILLLKTEAERISKRTLKSIDEFAEKIEGFEPYFFRMKKTIEGKCVFLRDTSCIIYETRPLICRFYPFQLKNLGNNRYVFSYTSECPSIGKGPWLRRSFFEKLFTESTILMVEDARNR